MINVPTITSVEAALDTFYKFPQLGNKEIKLIFGQIGSAKICELKVLAREKMKEQNQPLWNNKTVNTDSAYQAWGLDVADLERRYARLKRMEKANGEEHPRTEKGV